MVNTYFDIFSVFVRSHHLYNKVRYMPRKGLLSDVLDERAELHRESLLTLQNDSNSATVFALRRTRRSIQCMHSASCNTNAAAEQTHTHLLLANKRAPEHADPLADHGDVELVFLLEPCDNVFESGVVLEFETVPQRQL